jgi:hypothetical protein
MHLILSTAVFISACTLAQAASYSVTDSLRAVDLAAATYCENLELWNCGEPCFPGLTDVTVIRNLSTDTFGFVAYNPKEKEIVVSFRGSVSAANWKTNNQVETKAHDLYPQSKVHSG